VVHLAPSTPGRRRFDLIIGGFLALLGIAVAVLAVVALGQPDGHRAAKAVTTPASASGSLSSEVTASRSASASTSAGTSGSATKSDTTAASSTASTPVVNVKAIPLVVLNATSRTGLAASAAHTFEAGGWTVTSAGNIVNDIVSTCAYYDPSDPRNQVAAQALMTQFPAIKRIKEKFSGLPAGPVVVVLTTDYS
jgi:hypothetical protein